MASPSVTPIPQPPDVRAQGQPSPGSGDSTPAIMQYSSPKRPTEANTVGNMQQAMDAFEKATENLYGVIKDVDPQAEALFPALINIGKDLKSRIQKLSQQASQGSATPNPTTPANNPAEAPPGPVAATPPPDSPGV